MAYPYDHRMHPRSQAQREQHVPLRVVRPVVEERDRLRAELQRLRRHNDQLSEALEAARAERDRLARRSAAILNGAEDRGHNGNHGNNGNGQQHGPQPTPRPPEAGPAGAPDSALIARLRQRVETLGGDVERANRRAARATDEATALERRRLLARMGEVLDSVERALEQVREPGPVREGIDAIRRQLVAFLQAEGVTLVGAPGEPLDPRLHEAIGVVKSPRHRSGEIVRVERHGLVLDDGTIARHAEVVVAG